jgi:hypothetical protein
MNHVDVYISSLSDYSTVFRWLDENIGKTGWKYRRVNIENEFNNGESGIKDRIIFEEESHVTAFLIRWGTELIKDPLFHHSV